VLAGEVSEVLLLDVEPLSLGIETLGGVMTVLIPRNTTIPTKKMEVFSTAENNQTTVDIHVLQGERPMAVQNKTIGRFQLTGIPPAPRGMPQVEVTFDIDANGILHVSAKDRATGKKQSIRIEATSGLSDTEIERMVKEAEEHSEEDQSARELIELRNKLDTLIYRVEKDSAEWVDKLDEGTKKRLDEALEGGKKALKESQELPDLNRAHDELMQAFSAAGQKLYEAQAATADAGGADASGGTESEAEPEVVEADYEIVDEDKEKKEEE
jgi:molecular chaperone DnaK